MKEAFSNYAKLGLIHFMAYPDVMKGQGLVESLESIAADADLEVIEITSFADETARARAQQILAASAITVAFGAQPIILGGKLDLGALSDAERTRAVKRLKDAIDEAIAFRAVGFAVMSGPDPGPERREPAMQALEQSLCELSAHADAKGGPPVLLETFDRVPFGKNCLVGPTDEAVALARRVRRKHARFGLMVDLSHLPLLGESPEACLGVAKDVLAHVHVGNCVIRDPKHPAYGDNHPRFGCEGGENGVPELAAFLRALLDVGYLDPKRRPIVSFEVKPMAGESSGAVIANAKRTLAEAWRMV